MLEFLKKANDKIDKYSNIISRIILWIAFIFIALWSIPITKQFLKDNIIPGNPQTIDVYIVFLTIVISALVIIMKAFTKTNFEILDKLTKSSYIIDENFLKKGVHSVYTDASFQMNKKRSKKEHMQIDILGFTLFSASSNLEAWFQDDKLKNITVNLHYLHPEFTKNNPVFESTWTTQTELSLETINKFISNHKFRLNNENAIINLIPFRHVPSIHGFKISDGNYYISFANWSTSYQMMMPTNSTYVRVAKTDKSEHASELRKLYDNWLFAANNKAYI